jgi:TonB-dependent SusC/RagA subfamily outer membrane receptor
MRSGNLFLIIFSLFIFNPLFGQKPLKKLTISGVVMDANQKPVSGAIILIDDQKTNTLSDEKGFYRIKVSAKARIIGIFSFMNGVSEAEIGGRSMINFSMKASSLPGKAVVENSSDEESVNVGYGTTKRGDMTTSVGKIDATKKKFVTYQNIYDMISGEVPGVQVIGKSIIIQGPSTIKGSSEPVFVVDDVIVTSIDDIPPRLVKSIEILKGAAASIYGLRGTNGVILIHLLGAPERKI